MKKLLFLSAIILLLAGCGSSQRKISGSDFMGPFSLTTKTDSTKIKYVMYKNAINYNNTKLKINIMLSGLAISEKYASDTDDIIGVVIRFTNSQTRLYFTQRGTVRLFANNKISSDEFASRVKVLKLSK